MNLNELLKDFNLTQEQIDNLDKLRELCLEYNEHTNVTSITDVEQFNRKHILDSLSINEFIGKGKLLDVGSGGGFPGLALAITNPEMEIVMIDSNNKKIKFIEIAIETLNLKNAKAIHSRIEEADLKEQFDFVISRAVASLNILLEITAFASKVNGELIFYKGINLDSEMPESWNEVEDKLGVKFSKITEYSIDDETTRKFIFFNKFKETNLEFPRLYSQIKAKPIYN